MLECLKKIKNSGYILVLFINLILIDFVLRKIYEGYLLVDFYDKISVLFVLGWVLILTGISCVLPGMVKKIYIIFITLFFSVLMIVQNAYGSVFNKFFSMSDLSLVSEGAEFMDTSYIHIRKVVVLAAVAVLILAIVAVWMFREKEGRKYKIAGLILVLSGIIGIWGAKKLLPERAEADLWNANTNLGNIYDEFTDTQSCLMLTGIYEYTFRDIYLTVNPVKTIQDKDTVKALDEYFEAQEEHQDNNMTGVFKDRNLMLVQLENIDNWMLTEQNMPNLYKLRSEGIDFVNHYSVAFATGKTFNTEFIVNSGYVPMTKGKAPGYIYSRNTYPYSLAHIFGNAGYSANSYHSASGSIYNRASAHKNFGYDEYHNFELMGMDDYTMDSQLTNNFECMVTSDKFFDFIITYSGHGPFSTDNAACAAHIEQVKKENSSTDETYLNGLAQAKETDLFVENLLNNLQERNLLENTVLIFYTDHYAYSTIDEDLELELKGTNDANLLQNTPFFIWSYDTASAKIEKVTNTADILPTIANLFALDTDFRYYIGEDIFSSDYEGYAMFSDFSWYNGKIYYQKGMEADEEIKRLTEIITKKINVSWDVLETDYFSYK